MNLPTTRYINPFTDFGFKRLFGSESYKELLIDFLNTLLPPRHQIQDLSYRQNERLGKTEVDRKAIFDLYCQSSSGEHFIVELQKAKQKYFRDRSVFYASFPIQEQALTGEWNFQLSAVYMVGILDFVFDEDRDDTEKYFHQVKLTEIATHKIFYDKLTLLYLELPKFKKSEDEVTSHFEKWLYAFKHLASLQDRPAKLQERIFTRLFEAASIAKFTPAERTEYEDSLKVYRDLKNSLDTAIEEGREQGREEGRAEGRAEGWATGWATGEAEGRASGRAEGKAEGKAEGQLESARQIAKNLLNSGMSLEAVAQMVSLPLSELQTLKEK